MDDLIQSPVASIILIITVVTSLIAFYNENAMANLILQPYDVARKKRIYTVITSGLIHNDWMHLIFNMFSYYCFAFTLERTIGHWQFGLLYVFGLILSDLPTIYKHRDDYRYRCLGASGAVSAVIFSSILFDPWGTIYIIPIPFPIWFIVFGVLYLVYCHFASKHARDNVNHDAHLFGALSGLLVTVILMPKVVPYFIQQLIEGARLHLHL